MERAGPVDRNDLFCFMPPRKKETKETIPLNEISPLIVIRPVGNIICIAVFQEWSPLNAEEYQNYNVSQKKLSHIHNKT